MLVADIMSTQVAKCTEDEPLEGVYELMQNFEHGFVVVIDSKAHKVPIGIVTEHSICKKIIGQGRHPRDLAAGNVLDTSIGRINENAPAVDCAKIFNKDQHDIILVINGKREFSGIVFKNVFAQDTARQIAPPAAQPGSGISILGWT